MKNLFNKKKSKPAAMACNHCGAKKVKCDAQLGIGKTCRQCLKANRVCEWPPALEQELATASHGSRSSKIRSCATCKSKKIRCNYTSGQPCANCMLNELHCSHTGVAPPAHVEQPVAEPSNHGGMAASSYYHAPQYQFHNGAATAAYLPILSIDTSTMDIDDSRSSVTPSSGPSSPRSYWETVLNQEYSAE